MWLFSLSGIGSAFNRAYLNTAPKPHAVKRRAKPPPRDEAAIPQQESAADGLCALGLARFDPAG